ncbi:golgin subfamily A member 2 isoform X2 [Amblyraja radiata]|uniref:golgin subfamily A member 2 isoform X2 n=1 Tax=Amblyraja radiata TaxID=386614 RepID=UPI001402BD41|nr:golgin subfamily A member 2 isoform X2 [Amblyraja radiata]
MADGSRQAKLAAAKKKLKEFQQKKTPPTPGARKKRRTDDGTEAATAPADNDQENCEMPLQNILKVLVADCSKSNGVSLSSLERLKACLENDIDKLGSEQKDNEATIALINASKSSLPNTTIVTPHVRQNETLSQMLHPTGQDQSEEGRGVSSTESLRQLSAQLNGLVTQTTYVNGESGVCAVSPKELENKNNTELSGQLEKGKKDSEQKYFKEHASMREQLQVHIQTIGILVSEKSELQTALVHTQQAARLKAGEAEDLSNKLQQSRQRVTELERTLSSISSQHKQSDKISKEIEKERENLRQEVYKLNKMSEEIKQQNSELSEQLRSRVSENETMRNNIEDLHKKLEMAELMIQQFSNQSALPEVNQQLYVVLEEKTELEAQLMQVSESLRLLLAERDQYAQKLQEEGRIWQEKVQQLTAQVNALSEEKKQSLVYMQDLETSLTDLKNRSEISCEVSESQTTPQPEGPTEQERMLKGNIKQLQGEKEQLYTQYQAQVCDNEQLSRLNREQEERLQELERTVERYNDDSVDRKQLLENMQSDKSTISRALTQNRELKEQLAELQNGFVKLTNENMELTSALQSEQYVKKEVARKIGELQEDVGDLKEKLELKSQEAQALLGQRDQFYTHLQQYTAAYQQLMAEREELQKQNLLQTHLMDRLQHDEVQGKVHIELHQKDLMVTKEQLDQLNKENNELKAQISILTAELNEISPQLRVEGDGVESDGILSDRIQRPHIIIPEELENKDEMVDFLKSALSQLQQERDHLTLQFLDQKQQHQILLQQMSALTHKHKESRGSTEGVSDIDTDTVPTEVHEALKTAMDQLQVRFTSLMQEKVDLKERVEELEHRCVQLSGETDTIGEYIALYQSQRAILKQRHTEKEEYINRLAQDKEEMKMKLAELQQLVLRLVGERNEWHSKYISSTKLSTYPLADESLHQDLLDEDLEKTSPRTEELQDVSLADDVESRAVSLSAQSSSTVPVPKENLPTEDYTTRQIMQLLEEIQNPQARQNASLNYSTSIPFFYRPDEHGEVKITII